MDSAEPIADADADADADAGEESAAARFTEDLIMEILTKLPARSLHRFRCVSRQWLDLISDPDRRDMMAQTLAGFLYIEYDSDASPSKFLRFVSARPDQAPLIDNPSELSIPPLFRGWLYRLDYSNGLVLLHSCTLSAPALEKHRYAVCNPATNEWAVVPESPARGVPGFVRLAVDPSSSPLHFRVFEFHVAGLTSIIASGEIYSSASGAWTHRECGWDVAISMRDETSGVFFRGMFLMAPLEAVIASVDGEGNTWRTTLKPSHPDDLGFRSNPAPGILAVSQGRLNFVNTLEYDFLKLCSWELDDGGAWVMKHTVNLRSLFTGRWNFNIHVDFKIIAMHPDSDIVYFLQGKNNALISCAMARKEGCVITELGYTNFGPYLPYVPRLSVPLAITAPEDD